LKIRRAGKASEEQALTSVILRAVAEPTPEATPRLAWVLRLRAG
jgi:hypothetical protein